ncbi:protocatechuate 3,4-dioxygenase subunit alpha [Actinophytocola sediminis]
MTGGLTPSQTVGPFFSHALAWVDGPVVTADPAAFWLRGTVFDGAGDPVPDALIESWQPDGHGRFNHHDFRGYGRSTTDDDGRWGISTLLPGQVPDLAGRPQAPHIALSVFARGLLDRVVTRVYFADQQSTVEDPVLSLVPAERRDTLVARPSADGYEFDIRLQGERETVFFSI